MIRSIHILVLYVTGLAWTSALSAQVPSSADTPDILRRLLKDKHADDGADFWVYNNLADAMATARKENKPLFVTFRCVPCKACSGFDASVARGKGRVDKLAREKFIAVRQVEMKNVDLSLFQFDHDLNWAAMFVNADGVVYSRYGTQSAKGPDAYNSIEGLEKTMERVLELHAGYPANRAKLEGKRASKKKRTAFDLPGLEKKDKLRKPTKPDNCIHCHMIHDAENAESQKRAPLDQDFLWRYPLPENLGLSIHATDGRRISGVTEGSPAAKAGLRGGESILEMNGQAITSIADMQWVLHHLPNAPCSVEIHGSRSGKKTLMLAKGWKRSDISWRGSIWSLSPRLRVWAPELDKEKKRARGIREDNAFLVRWINRGSEGGTAAHEAGLRQGDVIIGLDGKPIGAMTSAQFNVHIKLNYKVGQKLALIVRRGKEKKTISVPLVE